MSVAPQAEIELPGYDGREPWLSLEVRRPAFKYLWVKYVRGFDIRHHCAKGLLGDYSKKLPYKVNKHAFTLRWVLGEAPFKFIYLCGNTGVWVKNLHFAGERSPGEIVEHEDEHCRIVTVGLKRLEIAPPSVDVPEFDKSFTTCRNWQFGFEHLDGVTQLARLRRQGVLFQP